VLFSSIHNLFALLGCKATFTHSLFLYKQERLKLPINDGTARQGGYIPGKEYGESENDLPEVRAHVAPRVGIVRSKKENRDIGTGCHLGNGYIITCFHCIKCKKRENL